MSHTTRADFQAMTNGRGRVTGIVHALGDRDVRR